MESEDEQRQRLDLMMRLMDPAKTSAADVAAAIAGGRVEGAAYPFAKRRMERGANLADIQETTRILMEGAGNPPSLEVLEWAAEAAWLSGDEAAERGYFQAMLDQTRPAEAGGAKAGSMRLWVSVLRHIGEHGRPGEAIDLLEPYLRDHPMDDKASFAHWTLLSRAAELAEPGERDRAALERFRDHSCVAAFRKATGAYLTAHPDLDKFIEDRAVGVLDTLPQHLLPRPVLKECAEFIFENTLYSADRAAVGLTQKQAFKRVKTKGTLPDTALRLMAADPATPPEDAKRALEWAELGQYGLWQLHDPVPSPGVTGRDLASGIMRYLSFPPGALDGVAPWSVWLGMAVPFDGTWRASGIGVMLSPDEADALAEAVWSEAFRVIKSTDQEIPMSEMAPPEPIPYGSAPPHGCRWDFESTPDSVWAAMLNSILAITAPAFRADVELQRLQDPIPGPDPVPADLDTWADTPLERLKGKTPRECGDTSDVNWQILIDSLFHAYEYQAALALPGEPAPDVEAMRNYLWPDLGEDEVD